MASPSNQSFIPRNTPRKQAKRSSVRRVYVFAYLSYTVFAATLIAAGGVFIYKYTVESSLATEQDRLAAEQSAFSESDIDFITEYEERVRTAELRLGNQLLVSEFLTALQRIVAAEAYFDELTFERPSAGPATIDFSVIASDFDTLLYQREQLRTNDITDATDVLGVSLSQRTDQDTGANEEEAALNVSLSLSPSDVIGSARDDQSATAPTPEAEETSSASPTNATSSSQE